MARYLDPKNDLPFKRIFGKHPDLLISFLNALMPLEKNQQITDLEYLSAEQVPENPAKENSIVDVRCSDNCGRQFIVEVQMLWTGYFIKRMLFDASKAYVRQLEGENCHLLQPVYGLAILDEEFDNETPEFYHRYRIRNDGNSKEVIDGMEFVLVELPKFKAEKWADRRMAVLWLRFLKEVTEKLRIVPEELKNNDYIRRALEICEEYTFTEAELAAYDKYWDIISCERSLIYECVHSREIGWAEGFEEGFAEGWAEGLEEAKWLINVVINCKRNGLPVEQIQSITGLAEEKILEILRSNSEE
ncbi:MAG: Rpn family recombination-promoting nuclease/putative transposase [Prevotellaceae bacterium]|jgi:predicted transposase/invertase (TIGR01784 family)|nr:Rpn family recombination-promoting nuclease/putative transposase [Prevotellaceae bacterium]